MRDVTGLGEVAGTEVLTGIGAASKTDLNRMSPHLLFYNIKSILYLLSLP